MRRNITNWVFVLMAFMVASCGTEQKSENMEGKEKPMMEKKEMKDYSKDYPEMVWQIFEAHGGMNKWKEMQTMYFEMGNPEEGIEKQTIDLWSRKTLVEQEKYAMGFDGEHIWLKQDSLHYKGDPRFYYNLMFYFYAMPFVLGDDGIEYTKVEPVTLMDKTYEGIKISYKDGVGLSSKDEYIAYYDPETKRMDWLAYTVTYFSKEKSKKFNILHYEDWAGVNGFILPAEATFYTFADGKLGKERGHVAFSKGKVMAEGTAAATFAMPEGAEEVKEKMEEK